MGRATQSTEQGGPDDGVTFSGAREFAAYVAAGVAYIAIGLLEPAFLFSWVVAAAYLLVALWILPTVVCRVLS